MREFQRLILGLALAVAAGGCSPYLTDRWRDAADVFTASPGLGLGAKARVGPLHAGYFVGYGIVGLRGGELIPSGVPWAAKDSVDVDYLLIPWHPHYWGSFDYFAPDVVLLTGRHKDAAAFSYVPFFYSFLPHRPKGPPLRREYAHQYTQIEAAGGLVGTVRIGFNPGELLDFLLGWTTLDLYRDDVGLDPEPRSARTPSANRQGIEQAIEQYTRELRSDPPTRLRLLTLTVRGNAALARCYEEPPMSQMRIPLALLLRNVGGSWRVVERVTPPRAYVK